MDVETEQRIVQLDVRISELQTELENLNGSKDLDNGQRLRQVNLARESHQLKLLLRNILQGHPRPFHYHRLPLEMLAEIFSWVSSAEDKLALIKTFPVVSSLMDWDQGSLYFSLVYPHVYPYIYQDLRNTYKLCQVSPLFHQVVLDHHRHLMSGAMYVRKQNTSWPNHFMLNQLHFDMHQWHLNQILDELENADYAAFPWMENMPFLFDVFFPGLTTQSVLGPGNNARVQQFLGRYGDKIWSSTIGVSVGQENPLDILHGFLGGTPNLYHLCILAYHVRQWQPLPNNDNGQANRRMQVDPRRYPDLPNLKFLYEVGGAPTCFLQQFCPNLQQLWMMIQQIPNTPVSCPHLENCEISWSENVHGCFENILRDAPLKTLTLQMNIHPHQIDIPELLLMLSHYGRTLETLCVDYSPFMMEAEELQDRMWMAHVNLPKVTMVKIRFYCGTLDFLLTLPSLRKLYLMSCRPIRQGQRTGQPDLLRFPSRRREKFKSNVWSQLTSLKYLYVKGTYGLEEFSVTRSEYEQYVKDKKNASVFINLLSFLPFFWD